MKQPQTFTGRPLGWRDLFTLIMPGVVSVLVPLGLGVWQGSQAMARYGPVAAAARSRPWLLASAGLLLLFLLAALARLRRAHARLRLDSRGVHLHHRRRNHTIPWDAIQAIHLRPRGPWLCGELELSDGRRIALPAVADPAAAVQAMQAERATRLLSHLQRRLRQGEFLTFGDLRLSRHGLHRRHGQARLWRQVRRAYVTQGQLVIEFDHPPRWRIGIQHVPDLHLALRLIAQCGKVG